MELLRPNPEAARLGLRAMKTVASAGRPLGQAARRLMNAAQHLLLGTAHDLDALEPITPVELAAGFPDPRLRNQLAQAMAVMTVVDGVPPPESISAAHDFARALGVEVEALTALRRLAEHHLVLFRIDFMRRSHLADMVKDQIKLHGGMTGLIAGVLGQRGLFEDPALAQRYRGLEALPEDTLGFAFFQHIRRNGFSLPGELRGFPESGIYHDMTHVLAGYDTTPAGEVQVGGFTAGYKRERPLYVILFVLLTFSAGVNMTPLPQPHLEGIIGVEDMAEKFLHAVERGSRVTVDLSDGWDFWPYLPLPLDEARRRLGVAP